MITAKVVSTGGTTTLRAGALRLEVTHGAFILDGWTLLHSPGAQFKLTFRPGLAGWFARRLVRVREMRGWPR